MKKFPLREGYRGNTFTPSSVISLEASAFGDAFGLALGLFGFGGYATSQEKMKCLMMSFVFRTLLSFVCKCISNTQALSGCV